MKRIIALTLTICIVFSNSLAETIVQSTRNLPLVREVDVVVIGGSSSAVAAALAAKDAGASVFLVAPRTYLGDDLAGTRQLWQEFIPADQIHPLFGQLFAPRVPFSYTSSVTPDNSHPDNNNQVLTNGIKYDPVNGSVQYNGNPTLTLTMPGSGSVSQIDLYYYKRINGNSPFDTTVAGLQASNNGTDWVNINIDVTVEQLTFGDNDITLRALITPQTQLTTRYLRLTCNRPTGISRQLLDEIIIQTQTDNPVVGSRFETSPLQLKRSLDQALESANIPFLTGTPVCDVLHDANNKVAGVVIANRSGRQAIKARTIIDATENAVPALAAGATKTPFTPGSYLFKRVVIADVNDPPTASGLSVYTQPGLELKTDVRGVAAPPGMPSSIDARVFHCSFYANLTTGSMLELLEIEQQARNMTWVATCIDQSDRVVWIPPDHIIGKATDTLTAWQGAAQINLAAFQPQGIDYIYLLSSRAAITRSLADSLLHPSRMMLLADRIGTAAATQAMQRPVPDTLSLPATTLLEPGSLEVRELLNPLPPAVSTLSDVVEEGLKELPVVAECDVLVVGGGTAGAPAAIAAGQAGASTIMIDLLYTLGGVQSDGRIGLYYHGNDRGFSANSVDPGWKSTGAVLYSAKAEWYRQTARSAGVQILFGTCANGTLVEHNTVKGAVVILPDGTRGIIRAHTVIDSTGNADIAAAAGAATEFSSKDEPALQGAGWGRHILGNSYVNNDVGFVIESSVSDVDFFGRRVRSSLTEQTWDTGQNPASRERRRVVGSVTVTPVDILNNRTWHDTIVEAKSNFDSHGFTIHDLFFIKDPGTASLNANLPFRALLPASLDGMLVTGLGISAHRDAMPLLRMQRDVQNQGYAAGYAAAMASDAGIMVRDINIAELQQHLVAMDIIDADTATLLDNLPLSPAELADGIAELTNNYATLHIILSDLSSTLPMLRSAYSQTTIPAERLIYGHTLALLGDATGISEVIDVVNVTQALDVGWEFRGMGQYGRSVSTLDSYLISLGRTRDSRALIPVMDKSNLLIDTSRFSHYRAVALALENLNSGAAVMQLSSLLAMIEGHALDPASIIPPIPDYSNTAADMERSRCLKELAVARALYRIGDDNDMNGKRILTMYANDPREFYASHARQILEESLTISSADGIWISTDSEANWDSPANWDNGIRAEGSGCTATLSSNLTTPQTISLQNSSKSIGSIFFTSGVRTIADGILDIAGNETGIFVDEDSTATLNCNVLAAQPLLKSGNGKLTLAGAASLGGLNLAAGTLNLHDPIPIFHQAHAADPVKANTTATEDRGLRIDFRVNQAITLTGLGVFDSHGNGLDYFKKVAVHPRNGGNPLAALAFSQADTFPLRDGYRFRSLPTPLTLAPGDYSLVTYGFLGSDSYIQAFKEGTAELAGTLDSAQGAITFLPGAYYTESGATVFPTISMELDSQFPIASATFEYCLHANPKIFSDAVTLSENTTLEISALDVRLNGGIKPGDSGWGIITTPSHSFTATLAISVPADSLSVMPTAVIADSDTSPIRVVKTGSGTLKLEGDLSFHGGLHLAQGTTTIDSIAALDNCGTLTFDTGGMLEPTKGGTLNKIIYAPNQSGPNIKNTGLAVPEGETLTLTSSLEVPRSYSFAGFLLQPHSTQPPISGTTPETLTTINLYNTHLGLLDLYLCGIPKDGLNQARHHWIGTYGFLRKLACGADNAAGKECHVILDQDCDIRVGWFDVAGDSAIISITNNANIIVENEVRFVGGRSSQLRFDGGMFTTPLVGIDNDNSHLSLTPIIFNGTHITARRNNDKFFDLKPDSAAPQIDSGNAIFDTQGYSVAIRGKGFEQAPDSTGALVKLGSGTLKIATQMAYSGDTLVSNGTLRLDFPLASPNAHLTNLLNPKSQVVLSEDTTLEVIGNLTGGKVQLHQQTIRQLTGTSKSPHSIVVTDANLEVNKLDGNWTKSGSGTLSLIYNPDAPETFNGALSVTSGTLSIHTARQPQLVTIPCPSFETSPLLPTFPTPSTDMDRRGVAANGCPGWVFTNDNSGYQRNGSYFSEHNLCRATDGVQAAYLRKNGTFYADLIFPVSGNYMLAFDYTARYYNKWYTSHLFHVQLDNQIVGSITNSAQGFTSTAVSLGYVTAGTHRLSFIGTTELPAADNDPCTLIDNLSIQGYSSTGTIAGMSSTDSLLELNSGVTVELDFNDTFMVGDLIIDGVRYRGARYNSQTHPEIFVGPGTLRSRPAGTTLLLR